MDYLRTLGSAAVSTLVQKSGLNLPFTLGLKHPQIEAYYNLYDGTKRVGLLSQCLFRPYEFFCRMTVALSQSLSTI
jgi:SCY1-like protein 1